MGAKMYGARSGKPADNDNAKPSGGNLDEVPIKFEDRRIAPVVEARTGCGWFCLVTVPQNEYRCADALSDLGIATYVPTNTYWVRRRKGKAMLNTEVQSPLFRGYVFAQMPDAVWRDDPVEPGRRYPTLGPAWSPIFERDAWKRSRHGILTVLGNQVGPFGLPIAMPLRIKLSDGKVGGLAPLADEEREGWFDERKRAALVAYRAKRDAELAELQAMRPVTKGERVAILNGPLAGITTQALGDNDNSGRFKVMHEWMGALRIVELNLRDVENLDRPMRPENVALRRA